jgi:hypothetical protein
MKDGIPSAFSPVDWCMKLENHKLSVILEKNDLDSDVVDVLILPLPGLHCHLLQNLHCLLSIVPDEGRSDDLQDLLVRYELPETIGSHHHELVVYVMRKVPLVISQ